MTGTTTFTAADGSITALGGASNDTLAASAGRGTFSGGRGNDTLFGSGGNNTYLYSIGDGTDHISDTSAKTIAGAPAPNTLRFGTGITAADITLSLGSLLIRVGSDPNDAIHIDGFNPADALASQGGPAAGPSIDRFEFDDGSVLTYADLLAKGFDLTGTAGNDVISGTSITDRIAGGAGNDLLLGGAGNDRYRFNSGDGQDVIQDIQGLNSVEFGTGLTAATMTALQSLAADDGAALSGPGFWEWGPAVDSGGRTGSGRFICLRSRHRFEHEPGAGPVADGESARATATRCFPASAATT